MRPRTGRGPSPPAGARLSHTCSESSRPSFAVAAMSRRRPAACSGCPAIHSYFTALPCEKGPEPPVGASVSDVPVGAVLAFAVPVVGEAVPVLAGGCLFAEYLVDHLQRVDDQRVVGSFDAQEHQFEEAGVDLRSLVDFLGVVVSGVVRGALVGFSVLGELRAVGPGLLKLT